MKNSTIKLVVLVGILLINACKMEKSNSNEAGSLVQESPYLGQNPPRLLNKKINTGKSFHPFIAPDESYLIFDSKRKDGFGDSDLYISFRQRDDSWGDAINFGDKINTEGPDTGGVVSPDGKYFFFNRKVSSEDSDVYWVDAQVIEQLKAKQ